MQIPALQARIADFERVNAQVLGISVDSVPCHEAWASSLGGVSYPLLSDVHRRVCSRYGLLWKEHNIARRAVVIVDAAGMIRYVEIFKEGLPDPDRLIAVLRVMDISVSKKRRDTG